MDERQAQAYLDRIGATWPERPDAESLRRLQRAHLGSVPFENLSIHLGEPIMLDEPSLTDKLVVRRRGGFCYELNGTFGALLAALGYHVTLLAARVFAGERLGPLFDHLALRVDLAEPWLVDVGFGAFSHHPLRMDISEEQHNPGGVFRMLAHGDDGDLDVHENGKPQYRLESRPRTLTDFVPTCWWQQTSPDSHFARSLTCSRLTESGRVTLSGARLIETAGGEPVERTLDDDQVLAAYRSHFGIELDRIPRVASAA